MASRNLDEIVGAFKPGSIRRIKLRNFLTYDAVEFFPGPRLNIVMGPNGTGKSTILNATCLGLGGEPSLLGRADDARKFITHGKEKAAIEIELEPQLGKEKHVFRRVIDANKGSERGRGRGASSFYINGEKSTIKEVREVVSNVYHISIDNLCTFLPQDRVGSFSGFDAKSLMHETEKSMSASKQLYETHMSLIAKEAELSQGGDDVDTIKAKLDRLESDLARMEREKERMEERKEALEHAELLEKKLVWLQYDETRHVCLELKKEKDGVKAQVEQAMEKVRPLQEKHADLDIKMTQVQARSSTIDSEMESEQQGQKKQDAKFTTHWDAIDENLSRINLVDSSRRTAERNAAQQRDRVEKLERELDDLPEEAELKEAQEKTAIEFKKLRVPVDRAKKECNRLNEELKEIQDESRALEEKLKKMNDEKAIRRGRIFRLLPNLEKVCKWLDENRTRFRRPVWGPIACEVVMKSANASAYLEQHVPSFALKSFVVECVEDYDLLYREVRQNLRIPVNILTVKQGVLEPTTRVYSDQKYHVLRTEHGVVGYMDESFTAPDPIMQALRNSAKVDKVLIGGETTQESLDNRGLLDYLSQPENRSQKLMSACIFSSQRDRSFKYTSQVSRYSGKPSVRVDEITPARILAAGVNPAAKIKVEKDLEELAHQQGEIKNLYLAAEQEVAQCSRDIQESKERHAKARNALSAHVHLRTKIANARRKLAGFEKAAAADNTDEKNRMIRQLKSRVSQCVIALEAQLGCHRQLMKSTFKRAGLKLTEEGLVLAERKARTLLIEAKDAYSSLDRKRKSVTQKFKLLKAQLHDQLMQAKEVAPMEDESGELPLKAKLEALPVTTVVEAQAALEEAKAKINGIDSNPDVIRQYEQLQNKVAEAKEELAVMADTKGAQVREIEQMRETWESALKHSVSKISVLFSEYMAELGCAGQVSLKTGQPVESNGPAEERLSVGNFKDWGIEIQVKFRGNSKFDVLSARKQSGGERSVSTIMYLMAMQDLMVSPFRFVDEINQGLDARNERLVFRRIVRNSTKPPRKERLTNHCGQYFLITPKLLPNLYDMEEEAVAVHVVTNGPFSFPTPLDWNPASFVEMATEDDDGREGKRVGSDDNEDEENRPNAANVVPTSPKKKRRIS